MDAGTAEPQYLLYSDKIRRARARAGGRATRGKSPRCAESQSNFFFTLWEIAEEEVQFKRILETNISRGVSRIQFRRRGCIPGGVG